MEAKMTMSSNEALTAVRQLRVSQAKTMLSVLVAAKLFSRG
jgi:hypothetical protein